jgi:hypothetical protein
MGEPDEIRTRGVSRVSVIVSGRSHSMTMKLLQKRSLSEQVAMESVTKIKSTDNEKNVGEKSLPILEKTSMAEEPTTLVDSEGNEFLSD